MPRHPLRFLVAFCLCWLAFLPAPTAEPPLVLTYGTPAKDWSRLAVELADQKAWFAWAAAQPKPAEKPPSTALSVSHGSHRGYATAKECVSMVEHGGSYTESSNPSHKGRYQFSRPLWIAFGGVAAHWDDWSLTSPGEQDAVFESAWNSPHGPTNWLPWDKC